MTDAWPGHFRAHVSAFRSEKGRHMTLTGHMDDGTAVRTVVRGHHMEPFVNMLRDCLIDALAETADMYSETASGTESLPFISWKVTWVLTDNGVLRFAIHRRNAVCPRFWDAYFEMDEDTMRELCAFLGGVLGRAGTDPGEFTEYSEGLF